MNGDNRKLTTATTTKTAQLAIVLRSTLGARALMTGCLRRPACGTGTRVTTPGVRRAALSGRPGRIGDRGARAGRRHGAVAWLPHRGAPRAGVRTRHAS